MAVSDENAIRSITAYTPGTIVYPLPDATLEGGHLAHIAWLYAGLTYATAAPAVVSAGAWRPLYQSGTRRR